MNYKHKRHGYIAKPLATNPAWFDIYSPDNNYLTVFGYAVPSQLIVDSQDWQPIEERKPLFTTDDGVEIYAPSQYTWAVGDNYIPASGCWAGRSKLSKYFSTEEAAKEYVRMNKPMYSRKDMEEFAFDFFNANRDRGYSLVELDELKTKIKQFRK